MHALWQTAGSRGHATASMYDFTRLARSVLSHAGLHGSASQTQPARTPWIIGVTNPVSRSAISKLKAVFTDLSRYNSPFVARMEADL